MLFIKKLSLTCKHTYCSKMFTLHVVIKKKTKYGTNDTQFFCTIVLHANCSPICRMLRNYCTVIKTNKVIKLGENIHINQWVWTTTTTGSLRSYDHYQCYLLFRVFTTTTYIICLFTEKLLSLTILHISNL